MASLKDKIPFQISHLDTQGQGVFKNNREIYFIPKTLPGESGIGEVVKISKGVHFLKAIEIKDQSPVRENSPCPHYSECSGCHYLHTNYDEEKILKKQNFEYIFQNEIGSLKNYDTIWANNRHAYRNRIQLHYDLNEKLLGFYKEKSHEILKVPSCLLPTPNLKNKLSELYQNDFWITLLKNSPNRGHLEIYEQNGEVHTLINNQYAGLGFSQVNQEVNEKMKDYVLKLSEKLKLKLVIDLFGGKGNLSQHLDTKNKLIIDQYSEEVSLPFVNINLYSPNALNLLQDSYKGEIDLLIIDPPRSGFRDISLWLEILKPKYFLYISCHPHTQKRDINSIQGYKIKNACLIDLFSSTYHFETLFFFQRKSS